jgi:hypothetical protein
MSAKKPDPSMIAAHSRSIVDKGSVMHKTALDALHKIARNLRSEFCASEEELEPIAQLISELSSRSTRKQATS